MVAVFPPQSVTFHVLVYTGLQSDGVVSTSVTVTASIPQFSVTVGTLTAKPPLGALPVSDKAVSYTHLDVYKRQG